MFLSMETQNSLEIDFHPLMFCNICLYKYKISVVAIIAIYYLDMYHEQKAVDLHALTYQSLGQD